MAQVVPAILETNKEGFLDRVSKVLKISGLERIQVDFGDGIFVPNKMLPVSEIDTLNPAFHWEAHLMIKEPKDFLDYQICGFDTILIHYEAYETKKSLKYALESIKELGLKPALVLNPGTKLKVAEEFSDITSHFMLMSVHPGFQGQSFLPETISRIKELKRNLPHAIIEVDGGINQNNARSVAQAGAEFIGVGSAITKAQDMQAAYDLLTKEAQILTGA